MEIYAIRHGQSLTNAETRFGGWAQVPLTELGREQALQTGKLLAGVEFDRIIVSDLLRAKQTTELALPGREYTQDWRLREISVGKELKMKLRTDALEEYGDRLRDAIKARDYSGFGGESMQMQYERVAEFMKELEQYGDDERIAIVCHEGTIFCMLRYVLNAELNYHNVQAWNASISRFKRKDGIWKLLTWNEGVR